MADPKPFRVAGLIGWPVSQSRSPMLHGHWLAEHGIAGAYVPLPVAAGRLADALRGLVALGFAGANVTVPHKEEAARLVDRVDPVGRRMGAINLIVVEPDGTLSGFNKDGYGFIEALRETQPSWRGDAGPAVVLGAGGGARSVVVSLLDEGAPVVRLLNRTRARAERLRDEFGGAIEVIDWEGRGEALAGAALLVNTTTQGMTGQPPLDIALDALPTTALVCDIVYNPLIPPLLAAARARGNLIVGGLRMLLHQARPAFEMWFGVLPAVTPELRVKIEATIVPK